MIDVYVNGNQREAEVTFLTVTLDAATAAAVDDAAARLSAGELVAFPTETVYGLGADATNATAVARLYAAKGRPAFNPLIAHLPTVEAAMARGEFDAIAERLARAFWPGPLTLVVPKRGSSEAMTMAPAEGDQTEPARQGGPASTRPPSTPPSTPPSNSVVDLATAGLGTIALRVPAHPVAHALLTAAGRPIVAPSANRSGHVSPTTAAHVLADLDGRIHAVLDGGPSGIGVESTILGRFDGVTRLLRPGAVTRAMVEAVTGEQVVDGMTTVEAVSSASSAAGANPTPASPSDVRLPSTPKDTADSDTQSNTPIAPGRLLSHYAPNATVCLDATEVHEGEAVLDFGGQFPDAPIRLDLSPSGDTVEAAANLYGYLRALDAQGVAVIKVARVASEGLGEAIRDRLARAAAGR